MTVTPCEELFYEKRPCFEGIFHCFYDGDSRLFFDIIL